MNTTNAVLAIECPVRPKNPLRRSDAKEGLGYVDGMSLYEYVRSNPAALTDPMGLDGEESADDQEATNYWECVNYQTTPDEDLDGSCMQDGPPAIWTDEQEETLPPAESGRKGYGPDSSQPETPQPTRNSQGQDAPSGALNPGPFGQPMLTPVGLLQSAPAEGLQGGTSWLGIRGYQAGTLRLEYRDRARALTREQVVERMALKAEISARDKANPLADAYQRDEISRRALAREQQRYTNAGSTNERLNLAGENWKTAGRVMIGVNVALDAIEVISAPEEKRVDILAEIGARWAGAWAGAEIAAPWGAEFGPWGVAAFGLAGGAIGGTVGEECVRNVVEHGRYAPDQPFVSIFGAVPMVNPDYDWSNIQKYQSI